MNSLSWLLYLSSVVGSLSSFLVVVFALCILVSMLAGVLWVFAQVEENTEGIKMGAQLLRTALVVGSISATLAVLTPNRQTVLLIAASEVGARVASSDTVQGMVDPSLELLRAWIEQQTRAIRQELTNTGERR
jgi:hypothetical protein